MTFFSDDPAALFVPPNVENPPKFAVGILREWDPDTFSNVVEYRGARLHDLAVLNGIEALSFAPGINVSLLGNSGTGVLTSFAILGRFISPGSDATAQAIQSLQSTVAREISAEIFAERISADSIDTVENSASSSIVTFTDLATPGPTVQSTVSESGTMIIFFSSTVNLNNIDGATSVNRQGYIGYDISGATSRAPSFARAGGYGINLATHVAVHTINSTATIGRVFVETGLNPGDHTVQLKYSATTTGFNVNFSVRTLAVISL